MTTDLSYAFSFQYRATFANGLTEHEFDHVFIGRSNEQPSPNPTEVADHCWQSQTAIEQDVAAHPYKYTEWFKLIYRQAFEWASSQRATD